MINIKST